MKPNLVGVRNFARKHHWWFSEFRWWRKLVGGSWEQWWVGDPVNALLWHWVDDEHTKVMRSIKPDARPTPLCLGTPTIENHK